MSETRPRGSGMIRGAFRTGVILLAAVGLFGLLTDRPEVGSFRTAAGAAQYRAAYDRAMKLLPAPTSTLEVMTDFGLVRAYLWEHPTNVGQVPVLLVPGRTSGTPMWVANLAGIASLRTVIAVDPLGDAGLSAQTAPLTSMADQADWLAQVVTQLAPDGIHLVGHSFGAASAAALAVRHPDLVTSLAMLEPAFVLAHPPARIFALAALATLPLAPENTRQWALEQIGGGTPADPDDPVAQMIAAGALHYSTELPTPGLLGDEDLASLAMPTYVAVAGDDSLAGGGTAAERARLIPDVTVAVWPGTTHSLPMEVPDELLADLDWLWQR